MCRGARLTRSPRVILVAHGGRLVGLVTVKDVLRHEAKQHHKDLQTPPSSARSRTHRPISSNTSEEEWDNWEDTRGRGLEFLLEEGYTWLRVRGSRLYNILYSRFRGGSQNGMGGIGTGSGFDYELESAR